MTEECSQELFATVRYLDLRWAETQELWRDDLARHFQDQYLTRLRSIGKLAAIAARDMEIAVERARIEAR